MKLILLPGLDGTGLLFQPLLDALPADIETVVITYPSDEKLDYLQLTEYVMDRLPEQEEYILLGESFSGPIAYQVALRQPDKIKAVVFVASFLKPPQLLVLRLSKLLPRRLILSLPLPDFVIKMFMLGTKAGTQLIDLFKKSLSEVSSEILSHRLDEIANMKLNLQQSGLRAVYIQASDDYLVPEHCVEPFKAVMANLCIYKVDGPHFILQVQPQACVDILLQLKKAK